MTIQRYTATLQKVVKHIRNIFCGTTNENRVSKYWLDESPTYTHRSLFLYMNLLSDSDYTKIKFAYPRCLRQCIFIFFLMLQILWRNYTAHVTVYINMKTQGRYYLFKHFTPISLMKLQSLKKNVFIQTET